MRKPGFTLVEILTVSIIIAILVAIIIPVVGSVRRTTVQAQCTANLNYIGQALTIYRQDTGVYPLPNNPLGALANAYPKILPKIPTCPKDPVANNDTYTPYYNYWGYDVSAEPAPLTTLTAAQNVFSKLQPDANAGSLSVIQNCGQWATNIAY